MNAKKRFLSLLLAVGLLAGLLPTAALAEGDTGVFTVTGGTLGQDYTYTAPTEYDPDCGDVLTIQSSTPLTISTDNGSGSTGGCRIVIEANVTANITLAGVNITPADADTNDGYSGIDLGSGSTLNITLQSGSSNVIHGGKSNAAAAPGPGIHVPEGSTLTIDGDGSLDVKGASAVDRGAVGIGGMGSASENGEACGNVIILGGTITVHGGTATTSDPPVDIGGGDTDTGTGGDCNTVIILTSVNNGEGLTIGGGKGLGSNNGSDGQGIRPTTDGAYTVYGELELPCDITIPAGATVTIPEGASLTVPQGVTLTNSGALTGAGSFTVLGDVAGSGAMGVTGTVTKKAQTAPDAPTGAAEVTDTRVTLDAVDSAGGAGGMEYGYTTGSETSVPEERWQEEPVFDGLQPATPYTFYARWAGNAYYAPSPASGGLPVTTTKSDAELGGLEASGGTGIGGAFQYGDTITVTFTPQRRAGIATNALTENTAALTYTPAGGAEVTLATADAAADGSFTLSYDTKEKKLPIGENLSLAVHYGGSGTLNPVEETVTLTLGPASLKNTPTLSGNFVYGETLTASYTPQDDETVAYQWYRNGTEIAGATETTYTLTAEDVGSSIYLRVSATDGWHDGAQSTQPQLVAKAPGSIEIACGDVTYGTAVAPTVANTTNTGASVAYTYTGAGSTSYGPSVTPPQDAGSYTVTAAAAATATHTAAVSKAVAFTIRPAAQAAPAAPALARRTSGSITLQTVPVNANGAAAEYGISTDGGKTWAWQASPEFGGLAAGSTSFFAVRYAGTANHTPSPASLAVSFATEAPAASGGSSSNSDGGSNAASAPQPTATPAAAAIPQTGDALPAGLLGGAALLTLAALTALAALRRRGN